MWAPFVRLGGVALGLVNERLAEGSSVDASVVDGGLGEGSSVDDRLALPGGRPCRGGAPAAAWCGCLGLSTEVGPWTVRLGSAPPDSAHFFALTFRYYENDTTKLILSFCE